MIEDVDWEVISSWRFYRMGTLMHSGSLTFSYHRHLKLQTCGFRIRCCSQVEVSRRKVLEQLDNNLTNGDERAALAIVKDLQGKPGGLRCFGAARQVRSLFSNEVLPRKLGFLLRLLGNFTCRCPKGFTLWMNWGSME